MTAVIERRARLSIVALEGTLRAPHTAELTRRIQALLDRGERRIVVSLSDLTDIDAAGVGELVRAYNLATAARWRAQDSKCAEPRSPAPEGGGAAGAAQRELVA